MSRTPAQVSQDIRENLATTLPSLSLEIGTPERKIIDAVAEAISEGYLDQYVTGSSLDIDTKSGLELEQVVGIFGFGRLQGRRATGVVRMELSTVATQDIFVQTGTQFFVPNGGGTTGTPLYFSTTQPAVLTKGTYSVDIPVECSVAGAIGNVPAGAISSVSASVGVSSVTNLAPMTGGIDVESDDELRQRFKNTLLRNIAGTEDFYRALCLQNQNVSKVAIFGPTTWYRTQVAAPSTDVTLPVHQDVKYVWTETQSVFKNLAQPNEVFYAPGQDYTFNGGASARLTRNASGTIVAGDILDVEFEYTTRSSRNDPVNGITNKVDIFVNGAQPFIVSEKTVVPATTFSSVSTNQLYTGNFRRRGTASTQPSVANRFMRLGSVPLVSFPSTLVLKSADNAVTTTYTEGVHYWVVESTTLLAGSEREVTGLEWLPAASGGPPNNQPITVSYTYNRLPELLNALVKTSKQITTDVLVHQAAYRYLRVHLSVEYNRGASVEQTNVNIQNALRGFFAGFDFGQWVEMSDIILVVHQVTGVDNVWITPSSESAANYGVRVYPNGDPSSTPLSSNVSDFKLDDNQLPVFLDAVISRRANR